MCSKRWLVFTGIAAVCVGILFLADILSIFGIYVHLYLLQVMLVFGWPGVAAWLGICAGKHFTEGWYLPVLFAWIMRFVFPFSDGGTLAWIYVGALLLIGLITMVGTRLSQ